MEFLLGNGDVLSATSYSGVRILTDIRQFSLHERNCETTTDTLVEGEPANRQFKGAVGLALLGLAVVIFAK